MQVTKSVDVYWVPTVWGSGEGGLERTWNANLKVFDFILELKWEIRALG